MLKLVLIIAAVVAIVIADVTDEIDVATVVADKLVEPMFLRMVVARVLRIALMPFTDQGRRIAGRP